MDSREIDAMVAEKVFGWKWYCWKDENYAPTEETKNIRWIFHPSDAGDHLRLCSDADMKKRPLNGMSPCYSTRIEDAWMVGEKVGGLWGVGFAPGRKLFTAYFQPRIHDITFRECADTAPMAICLAALKSVGVVGEKGE